MGKRNSQRKNVALLDSDDDDTSSSTSTVRSDLLSVTGTEEVQLDKDSLLDQALEDTYEKRGSTREKALSSIVEAFTNNLQYEFVEKKFATLLHQCLNSIKRGSAKEVSLASRVIGLLAVTVGCGDNSHEILEESVPVLSQALKSSSDSLKAASLLECLAIVTFVCGTEPDETEKSMQIMWQLAHPKMGSNVVAKKISPAVISAVVSAWSFLLTTMNGGGLDPKNWQESISFLSTLLDKEDRSVRIAAGEALALIFEVGSLEKFSVDTKGSGEGFGHIAGLKAKIINQVRDLSAEAGGKGSAKKDLNNQRNLFRDILEFIEDGYCPETSVKIGGDSLSTSSWSQLIQLNFLKHFLAGGFIKHMQDNEFLHDVFGFAPKKKQPGSAVSSIEKRLYKSPNSALNKARTQIINKQRMLSQGRNAGQFAVGMESEEA